MSFPSAPLIPGDATLSNGFFTQNAEVFGNLVVDGSLTVYGSQSTNSLIITSTVDSTNASTGALVVAGGLGVGLDMFIGGPIGLTIQATTPSTNITSGALIVSGGVAATGNMWISGNFHSTSTNITTNSTSGTILAVGGIAATQSFSAGVGYQTKDTGMVGVSGNNKQGTALLQSGGAGGFGSCTVTNTAITPNSRIFLTIQSTTAPTSVGSIWVAAQTTTTGFVVRSTGAYDVSTFAYEIFEAINS